MANVDVSLDDIIKKRNLKRFVPGRNAVRGGRQNIVKKLVQTQRKPMQAERQVQIQDARQRLIQRNRVKFQDARDKLAAIAKKTDARKRLERIRIRKMSGGNSAIPGGGGGRIKALSAGIQRNNNLLRRTIPGRQYLSEPRGIIPRVLRRTVDNEIPQSRQSHMYWRGGNTPMGMASSGNRLTRTVSGSPPRLMMMDTLKLSLSNPLPLKRSLPYDDFDQFESALRRNREMGITARGPIDYPNQMRSLAPVKRNVPSPEIAEVLSPLQGYKILVENLQASVSQEDITELFSDVGPLRRARLVRPGTAEVIFVNQSDAAKAVETYHNRQLDGRPMKCMLLSTQTPTSTPTSSGGSIAAMKYPTGGRSSVTPDIATIHRALFNKV